jgi:hypothetical protein
MPGFTNFPNGITSLGIPTFGTGSLPPFTGNYWFVEENPAVGIGNPGGKGSASQPFNTLDQALAAATPNNNDVIFLTGTVHRTAALGSLLWDLNNTHLIGICAPQRRGKRARISVSGSTGFNQLVKVTGTGCMFANFGTFYGFPSTSSALVCWEDDGGENYYGGVEFLGFGDGTVTTGTSNLTGARALKLNSNIGQNTFAGCVFGVDTIQRGAVNYTVEIAGGSPRNTFQDCDFESDLASGGAGGSHFLIGSAGIDRYLSIKGSRLFSSTLSGGTAMTQGVNVSGSAGGVVLLDGVATFGITNVETSPSGSVFTSNASPNAAGNKSVST